MSEIIPLADLHTHTVYSHGEGTIEQNIQAAISRGLQAVAIAEHGPSHRAYGIRGKRLQRYLDEIALMQDRYAGIIRILAGIEANILSLDGRTDVDDGLAQRLDFVVLGYHRTGISPNPIDWLAFYPMGTLKKRPVQGLKQREKNTRAFLNAMVKTRVDALAHPNRGAECNLEELAAACAARGIWMEINNRDDAFSVEGIAMAKRLGAKFLLSSDAHRPQDVGELTSAIHRAKQAGLVPRDIVNVVGGQAFDL